MCGVRRVGAFAALTGATCLLLVLGTIPALAQSGFGGSFESGSSAPQVQPSQPPVAGGFGGSFDNLAPPSPVPVAPSPVDQGFPDGNSTNPLPDVSIDQQILAFETRDFGVPPTGNLKSGRMHSPTPTTVPGAGMVSTARLAKVMAAGDAFVLIDVLGSDYSLPGAFMAPKLADPGHFADQLQGQAEDWLAEISGSDWETPIVIYCSDPHCWLSYNATLRVVAAGFTHVYWYRGGMQAWKMAGQRIVPSGF